MLYMQCLFFSVLLFLTLVFDKIKLTDDKTCLLLSLFLYSFKLQRQVVFSEGGILV